MSGYIGTQPVPQATQTRDSFTATSGQTSFATGGYTPNYLDVYLNGVKLAAADYTASNGSDVVLASGAVVNDILEVVAYTAFDTANVTGATNFTVTGAFTSQGIDDNGNATAITIDSSENVLVGKTATGIGTVGAELKPTGELLATVNNDSCAFLNRKGSDGSIVQFRKDSTTVGSIGVSANILSITGKDGNGGIAIQNNSFGDIVYPASNTSGGASNGAIDLGYNNGRWKDLYLSGGVYLGGTGAANKLDDYEEGTFSAALISTSGGTITLHSSYDTFFYTKVGNLVHISGYIRISSVSSQTGAIRFTLPFTAANLGDSSSAILVLTNGLASGSVTDMWAECSDNSPYVYIYAGGGTGITGTSAQQTQAGTDFRISGTYKTNA